MDLPFFHKAGVKTKKSSILNDSSSSAYPRLSSLIQTSIADEPILDNSESLTPEDIDENFFYKHITTHFHSLFCDSAMVCIPHSKSIQGLVMTKDIIESHCFQPSPYFCGQYVATKQKQKIIALDFPIITTILGFKEERTVHIMEEETVYLKNKKIRLFSIDRLLEGDPPTYQHFQKHAITIPPVRNSRTDLEFLNMFSENLEALYELQLAVQEFTDSYVYIKGYNKATVERIQHMYMKTYRTILERNTLLQDSCRTPSEHDRFLELVENVVMGFLHKKIWVQSLQSLLASHDRYVDTICDCYSDVELSQYSLRYPISEMRASDFKQAIDTLRQLDSNDHIEPYTSTLKHIAFTPLEKLAVVKTTLDHISSAVHDYIQGTGNGMHDTSVTSDEMIPLLAYIIVQSHVPRIASSIYYMQHYRLARMVEGSVYSFVVTTMKTAIQFLKDDPLFLLNHLSLIHTRSTSLDVQQSTEPVTPSCHRKTQSADLYSTVEPSDTHRRNSAILRPHIVLPNPRHHDHRKSLEIPHDWLLPTHTMEEKQQQIPSRHLAASKPMIQTTFPKISNSTPLSAEPSVPKLGRSLSASTVVKKKASQPPTIINLRDRVSFDGIQRPASISLDTRSLHSIEDSAEDQEELMGDFLMGLSKLDGDVVGARSGSFKTFRRL